MRRSIVLAVVGAMTVTWLYGQTPNSNGKDLFENPVRLKAENGSVRVERPGYAAPCWADIDGDGKNDLLVGQFHQGKIRVYKNIGDGKLAAGAWLMAEGKVAEVPGVW